jgi:hypothetical protein
VFGNNILENDFGVILRLIEVFEDWLLEQRLIVVIMMV